jgi:hypothetical protein
MKRTQWVLLAMAACLCFAAPARSQMRMDFFKKPNIADIFKPVVGAGSVYETQKTDAANAAKQPTEMTIVGKDVFEGKEAYWLEFDRMDDRSGAMVYAKMLVTKDDFQFHKMVVQRPGQPAMEMPFRANDAQKRQQDELDKWHVVGPESMTVPAGTFSCQHWKKDQGVGDVWVSDKVSPFGMIKYVSSGETMTLTKVISDAKDHITGPVQQFDPNAIRQQMMERMQQQQQTPKP